MTRDARGAALVESIFFCLILLVPIAWTLAVLDRVHSAALASTAAARDGGFAGASARDTSSADAAIRRAVAEALRDQDLDVRNARLSWSAPDGLERGARVEIVVSYRVEVLGRWLPFASIDVSARHAAYVQPFRSQGE